MTFLAFEESLMKDYLQICGQGIRAPLSYNSRETLPPLNFMTKKRKLLPGPGESDCPRKPNKQELWSLRKRGSQPRVTRGKGREPV